MAISVDIDLGYEFTVKAKAADVFAVLSDVPTSVSHFPKVEKLIGDRNAPGGYKALEGRTWDVVIDNPVQVPRWVREAGAVLAPNVGKYVFVSTLSTYKNRGKIGISEADVDQLNAPSAPDATEKDASYGERKVRGEMDAKAAPSFDSVMERVAPVSASSSAPAPAPSPSHPTASTSSPP